MDGENTKDENIADSIGAQIAFAAFQNRKKKIGRQAKLPYMEHVSDEALFYLSIANVSRDILKYLMINFILFYFIYRILKH